MVSMANISVSKIADLDSNSSSPANYKEMFEYLKELFLDVKYGKRNIEDIRIDGDIIMTKSDLNI